MKTFITFFFLIICSQTYAQQADSIHVLCRYLYGESRGSATKEMLINLRDKIQLCEYSIKNEKSINSFTNLIEKCKRRKEAANHGNRCMAFISFYRNGIITESYCIDQSHIYFDDNYFANAHKIITKFKLDKMCASNCDTLKL